MRPVSHLQLRARTVCSRTAPLVFGWLLLGCGSSHNAEPAPEIRRCDYEKESSDDVGIEMCQPDETQRHGLNLDRVVAAPCPSATGSLERCSHPINMGVCTKDDDCINGGVCVDGRCECPAECMTDTDCGSERACQCPLTIAGQVLSRVEAGNRCVPANCRDSTDCGGAACGVSVGGCGEISGFYCRTTHDECQLNADCPSPSFCRYDPELTKWACGSPNDCS